MTDEILIEDFFFDKNQTEESKAFFDFSSGLVMDIRDYGLYLLNLINQKGGKSMYETTLFFLFKEYLEMLDGYYILIEKTCEKPSTLLLRSLFEYYLCMKFICSKDKEFRALSYQVKIIRDAIKVREELMRASNNVPELIRDRLILANNLYKGSLDEEPLKTINDYWHTYETQKSKGKKKYYAKWYELKTGINSLAKLAKMQDCEKWYSTVYGIWSQTAHIGDPLNSLDTSGEEILIKQFRIPELLIKYIGVVINMTLDFFAYVTKHFLEFEDLENLRIFAENINKKYTGLESATLEIIKT